MPTFENINRIKLLNIVYLDINKNKSTRNNYHKKNIQPKKKVLCD
jgi:hypothetical protein